MKLFSQHNYRVYGNRPDNAYFAMRFLKASYATFVHGKDVNWVAEAQGRRNRRFSLATKNPKKLGPVALRKQIEGLCKLVVDLVGGASSSDSALSLVQAAEKKLEVARAAEATTARALHDVEQQHLKAMDDVNSLSDDRLAKLEAEGFRLVFGCCMFWDSPSFVSLTPLYSCRRSSVCFLSISWLWPAQLSNATAGRS